jgi:Alpha-kinase family
MYRDLIPSLMSSIAPCVSEAEAGKIKADYDRKKALAKRLSRSSSDYYCAPLPAELFGVEIPTSVSQLFEEGKIASVSVEYECQIAKYPFATGGVRAAYFGKFREKGCPDWQHVVLKEFMYPKDRTFAEYKNQAENSAFATYLMREYRTSHRTRVNLDMIPSRIVKMGGTYYNMETEMSGNFEKWTNNSGYLGKVNQDLLAFTVWTYEFSGGYLLQGTEKEDGSIRLTDPAIICRDSSRFGPTNFNSSAQMTLCLEAATRKVGASIASGHTMRAGFSLHSSSIRDMAVRESRERADREARERAEREAREKANKVCM